MNDTIAKFLQMMRGQGGGPAQGAQAGQPQAPAGAAAPFDPSMFQANAVPPPGGDAALNPMLQSMTQGSGILALLRNLRNRNMNGVQDIPQ